MISDSDYQLEESVLTPLLGVVSGLFAATMMLVFIFILQPVSGVSLGEVLARIGGVIGGLAPGGNQVIMLGVLLHGGLGALFGLLYAVCQQRIPGRGLAGVGLFYGLMLWVASFLMTGLLFGEAVETMVRSWLWLGTCLSYGLSLALCAIWAESRRPAQRLIVPKD